MKNVLVVDDDHGLLLSIEEAYKGQQDVFRILTARNGEEALTILQEQEVALLITDLQMPKMDGIQLLARMSVDYPDVINVVMTAFGTHEIEVQFKSLGTYKFLNKPIDVYSLEDCILSALHTINEQKGSVSGLILAHFLQLIAAEQKTCSITVFNWASQKGTLHFSEGKLLAANTGSLHADEAVVEMVTWDNVKIIMHKLAVAPDTCSVKSGLKALLLQGAKQQDEMENTISSFDEIEIGFDTLVSEKVTDPDNTIMTGGYMAGLKEILVEMAAEMDSVLSVQVTGMDGITVAVHNPTGADVDVFSAKFAMVMKLVDKSVEGISGIGALEESLVQAEDAWILTRFINEQYYLGIMVGRDGTLGNVRLVAGKYMEKLRKAI